MSDSQHQWRACFLGAINGLLVGGIAYAILWLNVEHENQRLREAQLSGGNIMHVSIGIKWWGLTRHWFDSLHSWQLSITQVSCQSRKVNHLALAVYWGCLSHMRDIILSDRSIDRSSVWGGAN